MFYVADIVLSRLRHTSVHDHWPTIGNYPIRLLCRFPGGHFPDVSERRILMWCNYAIEGLFS